MSVLYVVDQGAKLIKRGNRIVIEKGGTVVQWVHAFQLDQVVLLGNIHLTTQMVAFLLKEGIDTVYLSSTGKYRGRLVAHLGRNIDLRRLQFRRLDADETILDLAKRFIAGKLANCRVLLRRHNRELESEQVEAATHRIRHIQGKIADCVNLDELRGFEGKGANYYFEGFGKVIRALDFSFQKRTRRPPRDPVNAMLSLGYTFLANAVASAVNIVGLDPYLGSLHQPDYGRPSLVLDLMEEFRPVIVDALVLRLINKKTMTLRDFYFQTEAVPVPDGEERENLAEEDYPVLMTHEGMKKFILYFEQVLNARTTYPRYGVQLSYRNIILEQARLLVRHLKSEEDYASFSMR